MNEPETIDLTPTWEGTMRIYIGLLESTQDQTQARKIVREDLMELARWVDKRQAMGQEVDA